MSALIDFRQHQANAEDVLQAMQAPFNPFTNQLYSDQYKKILEGRQKLPVWARMAEFLDLFQKNQILVMEGETGSGKTTQIPQYIVYSDLPHVHGKMIACTQPRRVAAMSVARRVADELDVKLGEQVGYSIRFEDVTTPGKTFLKYMTDGMLLREAMHDPMMSRYSTIIIDEAHERTMATDILMGVLKQTVLPQRPDLKLVVMSATLDVKKFQAYFNGAPIFKVPGRTFSVQIIYTKEPQADYQDAVVDTVKKIHSLDDPGDVLVFLTGEEEIEDICRRLRVVGEDLQAASPKTIGPMTCVPLYSTLPPAQQQKIFEPAPPPAFPGGPPGRKVICSTNIAETSLTIDGIVYVVDPGFVKTKIYHPHNMTSSLLAGPISKASAAQRAGRAGRTRPGKCFRLYTEQSYINDLVDQTYPDIQKTNLMSTIIELLKIGIHDLVRFDYLDPPAPETMIRGLEELRYLGAIDVTDDICHLTPTGRMMSDFALDPQLAKLCIISPDFGCSNEILTIVAMLSVPDVFVRPHNLRKEAQEAKNQFVHPDGDHLTLLNVYHAYKSNQTDTQWAWNNYLNIRSLVQADNIRTQIKRTMEKLDLDLVSVPFEDKNYYRNIRKALTAALFMQVAYRDDKRGYITVREKAPGILHPNTGLDAQPAWVLWHEQALVQSKNQPKNYFRTVTAIKPEWLLEYAPHFYLLNPTPKIPKSYSLYPDGPDRQALLRVSREQETKKNGHDKSDKSHKKSRK